MTTAPTEAPTRWTLARVLAEHDAVTVVIGRDQRDAERVAHELVAPTPHALFGGPRVWHDGARPKVVAMTVAAVEEGRIRGVGRPIVYYLAPGVHPLRVARALATYDAHPLDVPRPIECAHRGCDRPYSALRSVGRRAGTLPAPAYPVCSEHRTGVFDPVVWVIGEVQSLWHYSPRRNRQSIATRGLLPTCPTLDGTLTVCLATSPAEAWALSGGLRREDPANWDLWRTKPVTAPHVVVEHWGRPVEWRVAGLVPAVLTGERDATEPAPARSGSSARPGVTAPTDGSVPMADRTPGRRRLPGTDLLVWPDPTTPEDRVVADHRGVPYGTVQALLPRGWRVAGDEERTVYPTLVAAAEALALAVDAGRRP